PLQPGLPDPARRVRGPRPLRLGLRVPQLPEELGARSPRRQAADRDVRGPRAGRLLAALIASRPRTRPGRVRRFRAKTLITTTGRPPPGAAGIDAPGRPRGSAGRPRGRAPAPAPG